jgi:YD repeat-containing protein
MNGATKIMPALIALIAMTADASSQSTTRSFYDSSGRRVGSATTTGGVTTTYDASGRVTSREYTSGNTTTVYDAGGRNIGRFTTRR